jgi:N-acetylmuramoyl-L-alanine amidase
MYTIKRNLIPGLPVFPYRHGYGAYEGTVSHSTESSNHSGGDTPTGERNYEASTFNHAFVHFFVGVENGAAVIEQVADTRNGAYGAGPEGNKRFVHTELCMYDDPKLFAIAYDAYCWLQAKILFDRKLGVSKAQANGSGTLWAHADVAKFLGGSDHQDPIDYLAKHGVSWDNHVVHVTQKYNEMANPPKPAVKPARKTYKIVSGDTLGGIAVKTHVSLATIEKLNPTVKPLALQIGQTIYLS